MADAKLTTLLLESIQRPPQNAHDPQSPTPSMKQLTRLPQTLKASAPALKLTKVGEHTAIEVQNEHSSIQCKCYWKSGWMDFFDVMLRPEESETLFRLTYLIQDIWPAVDVSHFRLRLIKVISKVLEDDEWSDRSDEDEPEPGRYCQARLGVYETGKNGEDVYEDILIGPRILYEDRNSKKPDFQQEFSAIDEMTLALLYDVERLTPAAKKRLAEETYEGSSSPGKRRKKGTSTEDTIEII